MSFFVLRELFMSKREKYKLFNVKDDYLDYLRSKDSHIPKSKSEGKTRPFVGVVIKEGDHKYIAPLSSKIHKTQTDFVIKGLNENKEIEDKATVRFAYMFPIIDEVLIEIDLDKIEQEDYKYGSLLKLEINFINAHKEQIRKKARMTYKNETNNIANFKGKCCNFKLLEDASKQYPNK